MSRQRAVTVLVSAAVGVVLADSALILATSSAPLQAVAVAILRVAAVVGVRRLLLLGPFAGTGAKLLMYAAALFAVFGSKLVWSLHDWVWRSNCETPADLARVVEPVDRILAAMIAALILSAILVASRIDRCEVERQPRAWSVGLVSGWVFSLSFVIGQVYLTHFEIRPWCTALTNSALPVPSQLANAAVSGFEEELVFTGIPVALFALSRWSAMASAVALNVLARSILHLYYTEQAATLWWVGWVGIWSGAALIIALLVTRLAQSRGMSAAGCVLAYALTTAATHSLFNLVGLGVKLLVICGLTTVIIGCRLVLPKRRNPLWWLEARTRPHVSVEVD